MEITITSRRNVAPRPPVEAPRVLPLTPLDLTITWSPLEMWYLFDEAVPFPRLAEGLARTLGRLPRFAGRHHGDEAGELVGTRVSPEDSMILVEARAEGSMADLGNLGELGDLDQHLQNPALQAPFLEPHGEAPLSAEPGVAVARAQVTYFRDRGMLLALRIHHVLVDGEGHVAFARSWAAAARQGAAPVVSDHRDALLRLAEQEPPPASPAAVLPAPPPLDAYFRQGGAAWFARPAVLWGFDVSAAQLARAKRRMLAGLPRDGVELLSTNDVLHAHLWHAVLRGRRRHPEFGQGEASLWQASNLRRRLQPPLAEGYVGNAVLPYPTRIGMDEFDPEDVLDLAVRLRRRLDEANTAGQLGAEVRALSGRHRAGAAWRDQMYLPAYHRGALSSTNWSRFPFQEVDFGAGPPRYAGVPGAGPVAAGVLVLQAVPPGGEPGIRVLLGLHQDEMEGFLEAFQGLE